MLFDLSVVSVCMPVCPTAPYQCTPFDGFGISYR